LPAASPPAPPPGRAAARSRPLGLMPFARATVRCAR
jgi:hypothetical protein